MKMEDTGGQPEFMDMLPALTIGPALYLLFCKLTDSLQSKYTVSYRGPSGESTTPVESTYTVEEVLLTALASVSCFQAYTDAPEVSSDQATAKCKELLASHSKSVAYVLGTYADKVEDKQIAEFDEKLQQTIRSTGYYKDLVQFISEDRMILPINNLNGGEDEVKKVRKILERGMMHHFRQLRIPAAWLVLSLCLRNTKERTAKLEDVLALGRELGMPEDQTKLALWFLHHCAGDLMYFPKLPELEDTVISDTQIVYDSATCLIVDTFKYDKVGKAASEKFSETGQFSLEDIKKATAGVSGDYIPLQKLVKLLEHLNIIARITPSTSASQESSSSSDVTYFMPCILQNATLEQINKFLKSSNPFSPATLFIHFKCGFVPIGVFTALIAYLVQHEDENGMSAV